MDKALQALMSGTVGFFWPTSEVGKSDEEPERGFAKKGATGRIEIRTLNEDPDRELFSPQDRVKPYSIQALFPEGSAVILDIARHGGTSNIGGKRASVYTYTARTAISKVPVEQLASAKVKELRAFFPGVSSWAGLKVSKIDRERKPDGRVSAATLRLQSPEDMTAKLGSLSLFVGGHWEIDDNEDRSSIYSPVSIGVRANRPRNVSQMVTVLTRVQDLINVAYDMFVPADGGLAVMGIDSDPHEYPRFWNSTLMENVANRVEERQKISHPLFTLSELNGARGVSRWIRLHDELPSAFAAVTTPYRVGGVTWNSYLRDTAVGIERLIAASKRKGRPTWTSVKPQSRALADRVGSPFSEFVGDSHKWADLFWGAYNGGKHQANYDPDPRDVSTLALSGNLLLTVYLLQRCGMSAKVVSSLFRHRVSYHLRERVQELVKNPPKSIKPPGY